MEAKLSATIRYAAEADIPGICALLAIGAARMSALGAGRWLCEDISVEEVGAWVRAEEAVLARRDSQVVGVMRLQWRDPIFWPDRDDPAGYIHKLAVLRELPGVGVSAALIDWAAETARRRGCNVLRLDTGPWPRLCAFYERHGFVERDRGEYRRGDLSVRFERAL